jgi:hypothetical protein
MPACSSSARLEAGCNYAAEDAKGPGTPITWQLAPQAAARRFTVRSSAGSTVQGLVSVGCRPRPGRFRLRATLYHVSLYLCVQM